MKKIPFSYDVLVLVELISLVGESIRICKRNSHKGTGLTSFMLFVENGKFWEEISSTIHFSLCIDGKH